jgi:hypothetical protein
LRKIIDPSIEKWKELWLRLHGREFYPAPKCEVIYNVLYQMGIYPHVRTFRQGII